METMIQWYPGHIAKLERELQQHLKLLDVVIEVVDARIPQASSHQQLSQQVREQKPTLLVLNKSDLADPSWTAQWTTFFESSLPKAVIAFDSKTGKGKKDIVNHIIRLGESKMKQQEAKGLKRRPIRTGIIGMPNVGKSTLINALVGQKKTKTGHRAGVTRTTQWVRIHPQIELMDTPGLIPPKLQSQEQGQLLASVYSVGDAAFDEESIVPFFIDQVEALYPGLLHHSLKLSDGEAVTQEAVAKRRGMYLNQDELDLKRAAQAILKDFKTGRLGRITLERPAQ